MATNHVREVRLLQGALCEEHKSKRLDYNMTGRGHGR